MHSRKLGLIAVLLAGAGWASAQVPSSTQFPPTNAPAVNAAPAMNTMPTGPAVLPADAGVVGAAGGGGPVFYGSADYLLWQIRKGNLPNAVSTIPVGLISVNISDLFTTDPTVPGTPGQTSIGYAPVSIVNSATFGGDPYTEVGSQNGARFNLGFWMDEDMSWGVEASFFFLERGSDRFSAVSSNPGNQFIVDTGFTQTLFLQETTVVVGPPVVTTTTQTPLATFGIFVPRQSTSSVVGNSAVTLYGAEVNARGVGVRVGGFDVGGLAGFRYLGFKDELTVINNVRLFRPAGLAPLTADQSFSLSNDITFSTFDRVRVWNNFYGGQLGIDIDAKFGSVFFYGRVTAAVGNMHQVAQVEGATNVINNDPARSQSPAGYLTGGGLLSSPADNGRHTRDRFAFIPAGTFKLGCQFTDWLRGYVGYDAILIGHAARAGSSSEVNTLNTSITVANSTQNANIQQPTFRFRDQDTWVQGVTFGLEVKY